MGISKLPKGVSGHPAISGKDVQVPIVAEEQLAPVVVRGWFFNLQDYPKGDKPTPASPQPKPQNKTTAMKAPLPELPFHSWKDSRVADSK